MSNTYKDNRNVKIKKYHKAEWENYWKRNKKLPWFARPPVGTDLELLHSFGLTEEDIEMEWTYRCKGPNRWHYEHTHRPNRRKAKAAMKRVLSLEDYEDWDSTELPVDGKPWEYYY